MTTYDAVEEHGEILDALRRGDPDRAAGLVEAHVGAFDEQITIVLTRQLAAPLTGR